MANITVVGGGLAGLVASITCAEGGADVELFEAHRALGGRARSSEGQFIANFGPHVIYDDGPLWAWLAERKLVGDDARNPIGGIRFRHRGKLRRTPPAVMIKALPVLRHEAPVDLSFREWVAAQHGDAAADVLSKFAGVFSFDADPGRLSAAFVRDRLVRVVKAGPARAVRYVTGGWGALAGRLEARARSLGVGIHTGTAVDDLPAPPVIVATEVRAASKLLGEELAVEGARTALLDVGLERRRGDAFAISDLDEAGWAERFTEPDPSLAPVGHSLLQAQIGLRPAESLDEGVARIERMLDLGYAGWREREVWRRRQVIDGRSGALDLPGTTWRDRPAIDRGDGVFLAGDMVAAPGLLGEVAWASGVEAARGALAAVGVGAASPV